MLSRDMRMRSSLTRESPSVNVTVQMARASSAASFTKRSDTPV